MCGIFLFQGPGQPDPDLYAQQIVFAGRRGPHGHGWWTAESGLHRATGPLTDAPPDVYGGIVGHSRLSTIGDAGIDGVQPVLTKGTDVLAHNGNVYNWSSLDSTAATDSFALGSAYSENRDQRTPPSTALEQVLFRSLYEATALALLDRDGSVLLYRRRLPLFFVVHPTGLYVSSGRLEGSDQVPEEVIMTIRATPTGWDADVRRLDNGHGDSVVAGAGLPWDSFPADGGAA